MYETTYHRATSISGATEAMDAAADGKFLAGGQTLIATMKQRLAAPSDLIDISRLAALQGISRDGDRLVIGAGVTHHDVARSPVVAAAIPALALLAGGIGDPAVRHRGTLGGSIANNDPAADYPAALLALGAEVTTSERTLAAADFFTGLFETALGVNEIILSVAFPVPVKAGYAKFPNPASRYAMAGVFVVRLGDGAARVAATGIGESGVLRLPELEAALTARWSPEVLSDLEITSDGLLSDLHASSVYRAHLAMVMARRAVAAAG